MQLTKSQVSNGLAYASEFKSEKDVPLGELIKQGFNSQLTNLYHTANRLEDFENRLKNTDTIAEKHSQKDHRPSEGFLLDLQQGVCDLASVTNRIDSVVSRISNLI